MLGPAFGRTDLSRIFIFEPPDFFADFLAGFFLLIFVGKIRGGPKGVSTKGVSMNRPNFPYFRAFSTVVSKGNFQKSPWLWIPLLWRPFWSFPNLNAQKKILQEKARKILQILYDKNPPTHFCRLAGARDASSHKREPLGGFWRSSRRP